MVFITIATMVVIKEVDTSLYQIRKQKIFSRFVCTLWIALRLSRCLSLCVSFIYFIYLHYRKMVMSHEHTYLSHNDSEVIKHRLVVALRIRGTQ